MITVTDIRNTLSAIYGSQWQLAIYQFYCGASISPDKNVLSPLRDNDTSPSLRVFKSSEGDFLGFDYGRHKTYNVFTFAHAYRDNQTKTETEFSYDAACKIINEDLGLGLSDDIFDITIPNTQFTLSPRNFKKKDPPLVCIYPNSFGVVDQLYWGQYYISEEWLTFFDVGVVYKALFSYDKGLTWKEQYKYRQKNPMYYYSLPDSKGLPKCKLLKPYDEDRKWFTNIDSHDLHSIQGFKQADLTQDIAFLTSSLKDVIILRMLGYTAYALTGESTPPTKIFIEHLKVNHKHVFVFMDNDDAGKYATTKILAQDSIFCGSIFIPNGFYFENKKEVKDPSDYIKWSKGDFAKLKNHIINSIQYDT